MSWVFEHLDQFVQVATLLSLLGAGAFLRAIYHKISKIAALPETVDRLSNSVLTLSTRLDQMDRDVQEAIGVKRHITEILTRLSTLENLTVKQ